MVGRPLRSASSSIRRAPVTDINRMACAESAVDAPRASRSSSALSEILGAAEGTPRSSRPTSSAAAWARARLAAPDSLPSGTNVARRETVGSTAFSSASRVASSWPPMFVVTPVTLPPGRSRLSTSPLATGSAGTRMTIGIVLVLLRAWRVAGVVGVTITSGCWCTSAAARSDSRLSSCRYDDR